MAYHAPRPYMIDPTIMPYECYTDYANPSGHTFMTTGFFFCLFFELFHDLYKGKTLAKILYIPALAFVIALCLLVGFARLYEGVHDIGDIIYGYQWGLLVAFYFHLCIRKPLRRHIRQLTEKETTSPRLTKRKVFLYTFLSTLLFLITFGI